MIKKGNFKNKVFINTFSSGARRVDSAVSPAKLVFTLTAALFLTGLLIFSFPKFFAYIFAGFLMLLGGLATFLAWKIYKFKKLVESKMSKFNSNVSMMMGESNFGDFDLEELEMSGVQDAMDLGLKVEQDTVSNKEDITIVDYKKITWH